MSANSFNSTVITSNTTTVILNGVGGGASNPACEGILHTVSVGTSTTAGSVIAYDNTAGSGKVVLNAAIPANNQPASFELDVNLLIGLTIVTAGLTSANVNVAWR